VSTRRLMPVICTSHMFTDSLLSTALTYELVCTMVYNIQNYWSFGIFPSSDILQNRKYDFSEAVSFSVLR
jgi:hypothetical protein